MTELALPRVRVRRRPPPRPGRRVLVLCYVGLALGWIWLLSVRIAAGEWWNTIVLVFWIWLYVMLRRQARRWERLERRAEEVGSPTPAPARWEWWLCGGQIVFLLLDAVFL